MTDSSIFGELFVVEPFYCGTPFYFWGRGCSAENLQLYYLFNLRPITLQVAEGRKE